MTHSLDTLKPTQWAWVGLEESGYATRATTDNRAALKLLAEPTATSVIEPVDQTVVSPYDGQPDRHHNRVAIELELEYAMPVGYYAETIDDALPAIHPMLLISGLEYTDDTGVAGNEPRTITYSRRTADQHSASVWAYKLAENLDGSGNRQASEIVGLGARGGVDLSFATDEVITATSSIQALVDTGATAPYWQEVDTSGNLDNPIPDLSDLNDGRVDHVAREGTLVSAPFSASYIRSLELSSPASPSRRRANAGTINAGTTDEIFAEQDGAWEVSFELPMVEGSLTSSGIREAFEDTGLNTSALEIEYEQDVPDTGTDTSIYRVRLPHFRPTSVEQETDTGMGVWSVTGMAYADTGDDGVEIDIEGTEP